MVRGLKTSQPWSWAVLWHGILLGFLLVLSLTGAFNSFGQEPLALDLNRVSLADKVVDSRLEAPELSESGGYRISIRLKGGTLIELQPNLAELNDCCRQHFPDESSQQRFLDKRRMILNNMAAVLSYGKLSLGVGGYIKDRFNQLRNKGESSHPIAEITGERVSGGGQFGPRGLQAISAILHSLDRTLWKQAPLVIEANEFGGLLSLGLIAEGESATKDTVVRRRLASALATTTRKKVLSLIYIERQRAFAALSPLSESWASHPSLVSFWHKHAPEKRIRLGQVSPSTLPAPPALPNPRQTFLPAESIQL